MSTYKSNNQTSLTRSPTGLDEIQAPSLMELLRQDFDGKESTASRPSATPWNQPQLLSSMSRQDLRSLIDEALDIMGDEEFAV